MVSKCVYNPIALTYISSSATLGPVLFELRNRKLLFKQALPSRNLPRRSECIFASINEEQYTHLSLSVGILNFQGYVLDEMEGGRTINEIPEEHWTLIAMAGNEM